MALVACEVAFAAFMALILVLITLILVVSLTQNSLPWLGSVRSSWDTDRRGNGKVKGLDQKVLPYGYFYPWEFYYD